MSITTELRDFVDELACHRCTRDMFREIADRIDREHEDELTMERGRAITKLGSDIALNYIQLPKDVNGETIRIGDELEWLDGNRLTVNGIGEGGTLFYVDVHGDVQWTASGDKRHVQPDSWESIISDATALGAQMKGRTYQIGDFVERCKRLAGEDA